MEGTVSIVDGGATYAVDEHGNLAETSVISGLGW